MIKDMHHNLQIIPIPAFKDNYIWLIHHDKQAIIVDPGDAEPVIEALSRLKLDLNTILITHHHHDHIGGVSKLINTFPTVKVYAPKLEHYDFSHIAVDENDIVDLSEFNLKFDVIALPGHTLGHIAYYTNYYANNILLCGDTLFGAGCGRLFEGTPEQMYYSLQKLAALPENTQVYCTHEYTLHNLNFALTLEPHNQALINRHHQTMQLRLSLIPSLPSSIILELATNPFLRCNSLEIKASVEKLTRQKNPTELQVFTTIREMRNHY